MNEDCFEKNYWKHYSSAKQRSSSETVGGCNKVVVEQHTDVNKVYVCRIIYNSFEHSSTNQNDQNSLFYNSIQDYLYGAFYDTVVAKFLKLIYTVETQYN